MNRKNKRRRSKRWRKASIERQKMRPVFLEADKVFNSLEKESNER